MRWTTPARIRSEDASVLYEGFEAAESLIPFGRDAVEIVQEFANRLRVQLKQAVAAGANAADDFGALEHAQMLCDGLPGEMRAVRELRDGPRAAVAKPGQQSQTGWVSQRRKRRSREC